MKTKLLLLGLVLPGIASAHTVNGDVSGLMHGLMHPLSGIDHLLAMLAVGLWAAQMGNKARWALPCCFVVVVALGAMVGIAGFSLPWTEQGIVLSVLVFGVLVSGAWKLPLALSLPVVGSLAVFHGLAHGSEMPTTMNSLDYMMGFSIATALLHMAGISLVLLFRKADIEPLSRLAGTAIALGGMALALSS